MCWAKCRPCFAQAFSPTSSPGPPASPGPPPVQSPAAAGDTRPQQVATVAKHPITIVTSSGAGDPAALRPAGASTVVVKAPSIAFSVHPPTTAQVRLCCFNPKLLPPHQSACILLAYLSSPSPCAEVTHAGKYAHPPACPPSPVCNQNGCMSLRHTPDCNTLFKSV